MKPLAQLRVSEWSILLLFSLAVLWRGGKSLDVQWLFFIMMAVITSAYWLMRSSPRSAAERPLEAKHGLGSPRSELPLSAWLIALLYAGWAIVSYLFSTTRTYGLDEVLRSVSFMLLFLWVARMKVRGDDFLQYRFPVIVTGVTLAACAIGVFVYVLQPVDRFAGTFFDARFHTDFWPNAWAEYLLVAWPMMLLFSIKQKKTLNMILLLGALGFALGTLFLSYSRGALLAFAGQGAVIVLLFGMVAFRDIRYRRGIASLLRSIGIGILFVVITIAVTFAAVNSIRSRFHAVQSVAEKVTFTAAEGRSSIDERASFWKQSLGLSLERPLVGWGPYSFRFVQPGLMEGVLATSDHPHNVFLKLAMERGFPALILFISLFGYVLFTATFSFFTARRSNLLEQDSFTIACIAAVVGVLLHNLIDYNLQFIAISMAGVICLGLLVNPVYPAHREPAMSYRHWKSMRFLQRVEILFAMLLFTIALWDGAFLVTSSFGRHAMNNGDIKNALAWFERSHGELFTRDLFLSEARLHMREGNFAEASDALDRYQQLNLHDPRAWKMRGEVQLRMGNEEAALRSLEKAHELGKYTDLGITRLLAENLRKAGREETYLPRKLEFDMLFSDYADAIEANTHFIALSQNVEELQMLARALSALYPIDDERYTTIARRAAAHAKAERERFDARPHGILW